MITLLSELVKNTMPFFPSPPLAMAATPTNSRVVHSPGNELIYSANKFCFF